METTATKKIRIFRSEEKIIFLLDEYKKSNLSIKAFCIENSIAQASFHNWRKKYGKRSVKPTGFTALQITSPAAVAEPLFASVKEIKIFSG